MNVFRAAVGQANQRTPRSATQALNKQTKRNYPAVMVGIAMAWIITLTLVSGPAVAEPDEDINEITIGIATSPSSLDPHFANFGPNIALLSSIFETLTDLDKNRDLHNKIASRIYHVDDTRWFVEIPNNRRFNDGSLMTIDDVIFSLNRVMHNVEYRSEYRTYLLDIKDIKKLDDFLMEIQTESANPSLPDSLSRIMIMKKPPKVITRDYFDKDFNLVGSGPYKLKRAEDDNISLVRNEFYHGKAADFDNVNFVTITDRGKRVRALLRGEVDAVDKLIPSEVQELKSHGNFRFSRSLSSRLLHLHMDSYRISTPYVTDIDTGEALDSNPFASPLVRRAVYHAIDRDYLTRVILENGAKPSFRLDFKERELINKKLLKDSFKPKLSRRLLDEAGYGDGFGLTLHCSNDRYIKDQAVCQTIADMLTNVGIQTTANTQSKITYFKSALANKYSMSLIGWANQGRPLSQMLRALLMAKKPDSDNGFANLGRYENAELDDLVERSFDEFDLQERNRLIRTAEDVVLDDYAVIPLYFEYAIWATTANLQYIANYTGATRAENFFRIKEASALEQIIKLSQ